MNFFVKFLLLTCIVLSQSALAKNQGFAVVLIDMQIGFYERGGTTNTDELDELVYKDKRLLQWAKKNDVPVLVLEYKNFGKTDPRLMKALKGHKYSVITKNRDSGFEGMSKDAVIEQLQQWNVDSLIVSGINGCCCVKRTALGAIRNGFDVMTSSDIVGNINQNPPLYPDQTWYFNDNKFVVFKSLYDIIF